MSIRAVAVLELGAGIHEVPKPGTAGTGKFAPAVTENAKERLYSLPD